jgi:hypothetical protein
VFELFGNIDELFFNNSDIGGDLPAVLLSRPATSDESTASARSKPSISLCSDDMPFSSVRALHIRLRS